MIFFENKLYDRFLTLDTQEIKVKCIFYTTFIYLVKS
jgi:hypothetical protein